ncbi:hypothetical protein KBC70_03565 [Candidatus Woesebacteria bacterium]|nr:hypothetical protein [Candidatus Woesebacteria bacterium]
MIQDRITVSKPPKKGKDLTFDLVDISGQVPDIDELLHEIDLALTEAKVAINDQNGPSKRCGCW